MIFVSRLKAHDDELTEWHVIDADSWHAAQRKAYHFYIGVRDQYKAVILAKSHDVNVMNYSYRYLPNGKWTEIGTGSIEYALKKI